MTILSRIVQTIAAWSAATSLALAQVSFPDTAAGRALDAWLDAFNSGDPDQLRDFYARHIPALSAEVVVPFMATSGGLDLVSVQNSEERSLEFIVQERASPTRGVGLVVVDNSEPFEITQFPFSGLPPGIDPEGFLIDATTREVVIRGVLEALNERYVFPEVAEQMSESVRGRLRSGEYDDIITGGQFANVLTSDLRDVSGDLHLVVGFNAFVPPEPSASETTAEEERNRLRLEQNNCGFVNAEILEGNIGYLKFRAFFDPVVCGPTAAAAMTFLRNVSALVIDLRDNRGGDPNMVAFISSYFFDEPTHLNSVWTRYTNETRQYWTFPLAGDSKLSGTPLYVLTSAQSFSGAEGFAYELQSLNRAVIVGETTAGGAHPTRTIPLGRFFISVPYARAINPVTGTNWEGTGVKPDLDVAEAEALTTVLGLFGPPMRNPSPP